LYLSSVVVGAVDLIQDATLTKPEGKTIFISCTALDFSDYVHWYQKTEGDAFKRILYMDKSGTVTKDGGFRDFNAEKKGDNYRLRIQALKSQHSATYYCASWDST
ncbi:T-cell receptor gamma, partial [Arapaima gigas]